MYQSLRRFYLITLAGLLVVLLAGCGPAEPAATPTPTKTVTPTALPPTATPTATPSPLPPTATPTAAPTDTPAPTETPTQPPATDTPAPQPTPTAVAVAPTAAPAAPTATSAPAAPTATPTPAVDFVITELRVLGLGENPGGIEFGGLRNIYITVVDAAGNPIDGARLVNTAPYPGQAVTRRQGAGQSRDPDGPRGVPHQGGERQRPAGQQRDFAHPIADRPGAVGHRRQAGRLPAPRWTIARCRRTSTFRT